MAVVECPPPGFEKEGKSYYTIWETVFEIDTKYVPIEPIGRGTFCVVCSSIDRETNEKVAIKKIKNTFENSIRPLRTLREMKLLRQLEHDNIIALKDVMIHPDRRSFTDVYLVFELMDTDLHEIIQSPEPLSDHECQYFLLQLLGGLKYLHTANVIHRDLKPQNLFVNVDYDLKIGDFGLARSITENGRGMSSQIGTLWYRAPESIIGSDRYDASVDMWSVGCIFAELLGGTPLFPGTDSANQLELIVDFLGVVDINGDADLHFIDNESTRKYIKSLPHSPGVPFASKYPNANPLAIDLLKKMLVFDPSKRIDVIKALEHPYLASLYDPLLDPAADGPVDLGFDDDAKEDTIREMMWEEMLSYHPPAEAASRS